MNMPFVGSQSMEKSQVPLLLIVIIFLTMITFAVDSHEMNKMHAEYRQNS